MHHTAVQHQHYYQLQAETWICWPTMSNYLNVLEVHLTEVMTELYHEYFPVADDARQSTSAAAIDQYIRRTF